MEIEKAIRLAAIVGLVFLVVSAFGFLVGYFEFLPVKRSDQIELHTERAFSKTKQLDDVPANTYRLNCQIKINGYQYNLLGDKINSIAGLHGPNYANITFLANQSVLFSQSTSDMLADQQFSRGLKLPQTTNITVRVDFTLKEFPGNEDYYFDITWSFDIEEKDPVKEKAEDLYDNREIIGVLGIILLIGPPIAAAIQSRWD